MGSPYQLSARTLWQQPWILLWSDYTYFSRQRYTNLDEINKQSFRIGAVSKQEFLRELNRVNSIAWPMILVSITQFLMRLSPMFMLGHVDELSLSSASIAITFCNVSGFSVIFCMASALETLCGQAYGAEQYKQVGTFTYTAILCLLLVCVPVSLLWIYTDKLLIFMGQDPLVSTEAGKFAIWLIPAIFPYAILQLLIRYLQTQSLILPMLLSSLASIFVNLSLCRVFVFKLKLGNGGAAVSIGLSYWLNVIVLGVYVKYYSALFSKEVFSCLGEFFRYAIPSAIMVCEWWSFELIIFLSGLFPNPQLEMSVLSICMTITSLHFNIPYSFGVAARFALKLYKLLLVGSGVARGGGWQGIGGYVNLGAYYAVGIPVALVMGFVMHLKGEGLWIGLVAGTGVQCFLFSLVTSLIDWDKQAREARQRIFEGRFPAQIELI